MSSITNVPVPLARPGVQNLGNPYGLDLTTRPNAQGLIDLDASGGESTGIDVLAQSLTRRQTMDHGSCIGCPDDGINIYDYLGAGFTPTQFAQIQDELKTELQKDERVTSVDVSVSYEQTTNKLTITERIVAGVGPFSLTMTVAQSGVSAVVSAIGQYT
jgi:hypothetical protein